MCYNSVIFLFISTSNRLYKKSPTNKTPLGGCYIERDITESSWSYPGVKKKLLVREKREVALEVFPASNAPDASLVLMFRAAGIMSASPRLDKYSLLCGLIGNQ